MSLENLAKFILKHDEKFGLVDIGAQGKTLPPWGNIEKSLQVIGFEPVEEECNKLCKDYPEHKYYPFGLFSHKGEVDFFVTKGSQFSSIYEPIEAVFKSTGKLASIVPWRKIKVPVTTLDDVLLKDAHKLELDLLKVDTQGSEYDILLGGKEVLKNFVGVVSECYFTPHYHGQKVFSDVYNLMRDLGFTFVDFTTLSYWRTEIGRELNYPFGRVMACDALFIRNDILEKKSHEAAYRKAALILSAYKQYDVAYELLSSFDDMRKVASIKSALHKLIKEESAQRRSKTPLDYVINKSGLSDYVINNMQKFRPAPWMDALKMLVKSSN